MKNLLVPISSPAGQPFALGSPFTKHVALISLLIAVNGGVFCEPVQASESQASRFVGYQHPPMAEDCKSEGSGMIFDSDDLGFSRITCSGSRFIWLERRTGNSKSKKWTVIDAVELPPLKKDQKMMVGDCEMDRKPNATVFAIGTWQPKPMGGDLRKIEFAFFIDSKLQRIEIVNPKLVKCGYVGEDRN